MTQKLPLAVARPAAGPQNDPKFCPWRLSGLQRDLKLTQGPPWGLSKYRNPSTSRTFTNSPMLSPASPWLTMFPIPHAIHCLLMLSHVFQPCPTLPCFPLLSIPFPCFPVLPHAFPLYPMLFNAVPCFVIDVHREKSYLQFIAHHHHCEMKRYPREVSEGAALP